MSKINIEPEWKEVLQDYFQSPEFANLTSFVKSEYNEKTIYPAPEEIFTAFWQTPFSRVRVVILGQDPYHDGGQADGDGQVGGFNALGDSRANFGSHDTQIAESLECCDDFNFILGVRDLALVGQHLGYFSGQLEDIGVGLAFFLVLDAIATSHASQRQKSNGRVRSALNQRLQNNLF